MGARTAMVVGTAALAACANPNRHFETAQRALSARAWQQAKDELERFNEEADCTKDSRCNQARVDLAECGLRLGDPTNAVFKLVDAREPEVPGSPLLSRIERLQKEAEEKSSATLMRAPGEGTLTVRFSSRVQDRSRFKEARFLLDLHSLLTGDQPYVAGATMLPVPPRPVAAGTHDLLVWMVFTGNGSASTATSQATSSRLGRIRRSS